MRSQNDASFKENKKKLTIGVCEILWYSVWLIVCYLVSDQDPRNVDHGPDMAPCDVPLNNLQAMYVGLLAIMIPLRIYFHK
jgi:hypothetical protein